MEEPFSSYQIASHDPLVGLKRTKCEKCGCSRMFFCYKCHIYVKGVDESKLPTVKLPFKLDIIKHAKELDGKSTAIHAALLAPDDVQIFTYPTIPDYSKDSNILLVFPSKNAQAMEDVFRKDSEHEAVKDKTDEDVTPVKRIKLVKDGEHEEVKDETDEDATPVKRIKLDSDESGTSPENHTVDKVIFIDCTWSQAYGIFSDERIRQLPTVKLNEFKTVYWRHNEEMPFTYLATIEAIYYFLKQRHELLHDGAYDGQYDNLLYFYSYFHKLVQGGIQKSKKKTLGKAS